MKTAPTTGKFSPLDMTLHWWIAAMIVLQFVLANLVESAEDAGSEARALALLTRHRSVGITPLLAILVLVHVAAALKHALIDRDGALRRISSPPSIVTFVVVLVSGYLLLT